MTLINRDMKKKIDGFTAIMEQIKSIETENKYKVEYKIINGTHYCFGTLKGYDYSFEADVKEVAIERMRAKVSELFLAPEVEWNTDEPVSVSVAEAKIKPPVTYKKNRLDHL